MIVSDEVVNVGHDRTRLTSMTKLARDAIGKDELTAFAYRGYFKSDEILQCVQEGINVLVPKPFKSSGGLEGRFVAKNFSKFDDAQIIGIAQQVASHVWTNYLNLVAETDIDFPILQARKGRLTSHLERAKDDCLCRCLRQQAIHHVGQCGTTPSLSESLDASTVRIRA
jgi:hypothetical protein